MGRVLQEAKEGKAPFGFMIASVSGIGVARVDTPLALDGEL
jgi:hypothetical protein